MPPSLESTLNNTLALPQMRRQQAHFSILLVLFTGDLAVILSASLLGYFIRFHWVEDLLFRSGTITPLGQYLVHILIGTGVMAGLLYTKGFYRLDLLSRYRYGALKTLSCVLYWFFAALFISLFFKIDPPISRLATLYGAILIGIGLFLWRYSFCKHLIGGELLESTRRRTLVLGWSDHAASLYERSRNVVKPGTFYPFLIEAAVYWDGTPDESSPGIPQEIYRGTGIGELEKLMKTQYFDTLILADSNLSMKETVQLQHLCGREMVDFMILPQFIEVLSACLHVESFHGTPLLTQTRREISKSTNLVLKRVFDIAGAVVGLILSAPVIGYFCWRVKRESPGPAFYRQIRVGKNGKPFEIVKIRSMRVDAEKETGARWCTEEDPRRLKVGAFMRKYNIDELPQFWNVLKGEMSLVGPRPERPELIRDFKYQIHHYNIRHTVKPGITGWAQVNGWRGDTCLKSRIACDIEYIERWSLWTDFYICLRTILATKNAY